MEHPNTSDALILSHIKKVVNESPMKITDALVAVTLMGLYAKLGGSVASLEALLAASVGKEAWERELALLEEKARRDDGR